MRTQLPLRGDGWEGVFQFGLVNWCVQLQLRQCVFFNFHMSLLMSFKGFTYGKRWNSGKMMFGQCITLSVCSAIISLFRCRNLPLCTNPNILIICWWRNTLTSCHKDFSFFRFLLFWLLLSRGFFFNMKKIQFNGADFFPEDNGSDFFPEDNFKCLVIYSGFPPAVTAFLFLHSWEKNLKIINYECICISLSLQGLLFI